MELKLIYFVSLCFSVRATTINYEKELKSLHKIQREQQAEINDLKQLMMEQHRNLNLQQTTINHLETKIKDLEENAKVANDRLVEVNVCAVANNNEIAYLRKNDGIQNQNIDFIRLQAEKQADIVKIISISIKKDIEEFKVENETNPARSFINKGKRQVTGGIAFTAYLDHDIDNPGIHQVIPFNKILINDGSGFNVHTGIFTCAESGVYMFSFFIGERGQNELSVQLVVNNNGKVQAVVDGFHPTQDLQGGNTVILRLSSGDAVWVEWLNHVHIEGGTLHRITTFSGVFLYA